MEHQELSNTFMNHNPKKTVHLRNIPMDVDNMIVKQQAVFTLEGKSLKKEEVVYAMLKEWYQFKNKPVNE